MSIKVKLIQEPPRQVPAFRRVANIKPVLFQFPGWRFLLLVTSSGDHDGPGATRRLFILGAS
jgi:hypothetical protein